LAHSAFYPAPFLSARFLARRAFYPAPFLSARFLARMRAGLG